MLCPVCNSSMLKCIDSRPVKAAIKRRKQCMACNHRFNTLELAMDDFQELAVLCDAMGYSLKFKEKLKGSTKNENESNA